ncbi:MAG: hypothetical protein QOE48_4971 [Mycobacterium sp.]|nr:hypothetical protein [Mycobacterium sp.]
MTGGATRGPPAGNAEATWLNAGAAEVQPWGTDIAPSDAARPAVAVTAVPPMPGELNAPAPEPTPVLITDPDIWKLWANVPVAGPNAFISEPAEPSIETPEADIDTDEAAPETRLVPDVTADDVMVVKDERGDVEVEDDAIVDANPGRAPGTAAELNGATVWAPVPAEVPAACVTAAAIPARPEELVVSSGVVNGVNADAADDAPA